MLEQQLCSQCGLPLEDEKCPRCLLARGLPDTRKLPDDSVQTKQTETHVGHYRLMGLIGKGGMGVVFKAEDTRLDRPVAIKFLPSLLRDNRELFLRFQREARALSRTSHPHLCVIHDVGESERGPYLVMEYLDGQTLSDRLKSGAVSIVEMLELSIQLTRGIQAAHAAGVIHRDLKPANIIVSQDGLAKIVDFGLVKFHVPTDPLGETLEFAVTKQTLATQHDQLVGTVPYMSPEQAAGQDVDVRSDLFSLGIVFYEMLTGKRPFRGSTTILTIHAILTGEFTPAHALNPEVPRSLSDTISRLLSRDPDARYPNAETLLDALQEANSEWMTNSTAQSSSRDASVPAAPQKRGPVFMAVAAFAATAVVALLIMAWSVFSRSDPDMHDAELAVPSDKSQQENPVIPAGTVGERDREQSLDPDAGKPLYQDVVRGLVIEPVAYQDDHNPDREDPRAVMFVDDLKTQLAIQLRSEVRVIPVSSQRWQQSINAVNAKRDPSDRAKIGENLPELDANILLAVWGKFLPDQKLYVFHLRLFNVKGSSFFRRGFVFKEQELLENPDVCRDAITSTHIFYPKQPVTDWINSRRVTGVVIEPIFFSCNDPDRFRVVTDSMRENLQQQIRERLKRNVDIVSVSSEKLQLSRARHQSWRELLGEYYANFVLSVEGKFDDASQSFVVELNVTEDSGSVEFSRRFVYAPDEFSGDPTAFQEDILETSVFTPANTGDVLYPEFVTGLIVDPSAYLDQFNSSRKDPAASKFVDRLKIQLAEHLNDYIPVISVTDEAWYESKRVAEKKLQPGKGVLSQHVPELGANVALTLWGEFRPNPREYVFYLHLFTAEPRQIFRRRFVFGERQLLDDPAGCRNQILATPIFHPKQAESPTVDPSQFRAVAIAPILYKAEPVSQFGFVSPDDRERLQMQLATIVQRQVKVISTSNDEWERSLAAHPDSSVGANLKDLDADAVLEVSGFYQQASQSYVLRVSLMNHLGASLFERRFVYDEQTFQGDLETIWMKVLATRIFQKPDPQSRDQN